MSTDTESFYLVETLTIPAEPAYGTTAWEEWKASVPEGLNAAYMLHTHSYSTATCSTPATCSCGATTGGVDSTKHTGGTEVRGQKDATESEEGYTGDTYCLGCNKMIVQGSTIPVIHTHSYTPTYDNANHWDVCSCGDKQNEAKHTYSSDTDPTCDCGYNRGLFATNDDGKDFFDVGFIPGDGVTLPDDAELVVEDHYPSLAPIASTVVPTAETEYVDIPEENISRLEDIVDGYKLGEIIVINSEKYMVFGGVDVYVHLIRLTDNAEFIYNVRESMLVPHFLPYDAEIQTNRTIVINGAKYDVFATIAHNGIEQYAVLYVDGVLAGLYIPSENSADFVEGYDPETLKAQQDDNDLGSVTIPADYNNAAIADFAPGKTYNVSVIGANDISVEGLTEVNGTVSQTFKIPDALVGAKTVQYVAVHDTNPYAADLAEAERRMKALPNDETRKRHYETVKALYDGWEEENDSGAEYGTVTFSLDGLTLTATHTGVKGFSPFIVYAFVEADEPVYKELSATLHTEHTYENGKCTVCEAVDPDYVPLIITGGTAGTDYTYENGVLDIKAAGTYEIKNADPTTATSDAIRVSAASGEVIVKLGGVNIKPADKSSFEITGDCETTVILKDGTENTLDNDTGAATSFAGLQNGEKVLTITCESSGNTAHECTTGCGKLTAMSFWGAGIGGGNGGNGSNITISGGTVTATSTKWGAGIGGGDSGSGSNITVSGGTVTATGAWWGAGIGGGYQGNGSNITVSGGAVTATGAWWGAGIGGGYDGNGSNITISGGTVTATSAGNGAGIGGGEGGTGSNIKIAPSANTEIIVNTGANVTEAEELTYAFAEETDITALVSQNAYFYSEAYCIHADADKDHKCDFGCGETMGTHGDTDTDHACDYGCTESIGTHADSNTDTDHLCDYGCGATLENCTDAVNDNNHSCDVCGKADVSTHTYGDATCEAPATCSECGATTGDALGHKDENTDHTCDRGCGKTDMGTHAAATGKHTCDYCGNAVTTCTDFAEVVKPEALKSAADCTNPAVYYKSCTVCGANGNETFTDGEAKGHSCTYTASGTAITESCACGHSETATITAPENPVYDGTAKAATVSYSNNWQGGELTVTYSDGGNVNAGNVTASVEIGGATASVEYVIAKAKATITADDKEAYIGSSMPELTYTVTGLFGSDTLHVELSCSADMNRAGETPIVVNATDPNGNYEITTVNGTLTVKYYPYIPVPTYPPVIQEGDGGDVSVAPAKPEKGDTVIITPDPDPGKEVDTVVVIDENGNPVAVTDNGDGTYSFEQPAGKVTITVTFKKELCNGGLDCPSGRFTDLDTGAQYHEAVDYVLEKGLMNGTGDTVFSPNGTLTRAMLVTILWRMEGEPVVNYLMQFEDVPAETWYTEAIRWAASENIVEGYGTTFGPNDPITREQLATILWRYAKHEGMDVSVGENTNILSYNDAFHISEYAFAPLQWACGEGIITGKPGDLLEPRGSVTRAEAATMLMRFCKLEK